MSESESHRSEVTLGTWIRRLVVWSATVALLIYAGIAIYRVFNKPEEAKPTGEVPAAVSELPKPTGEYKWEAARTLLDGGRRLLRGGDTNGGLDTLQTLVAKYPESPQARQALLTIASTHRYITDKKDKAIRAYSQFIRDYPDDRQVPKVVTWLKELAQETRSADRTAMLLENALKKVEDNPEATARIQKLLEKKN